MSGLFCASVYEPTFRQAKTMEFAIAEINRNPRLLPNVTLGYELYDTCGTSRGSLYTAVALATGREERFQLQEKCVGIPPVLGIVGFKISGVMARVLDLYSVPMVSLPLPSRFAISSLMCSIM